MILPAFATHLALPLALPSPTSVRFAAIPARRPPRFAPRLCMCDKPTSAAERTRQALSNTEPLVKFRRQTEYLDDNTDFKYTSGVKKGSVDIWLITGILTFLVPLVGFAIGVATGNININPR